MERSRFSLQLGLQRARLYYYLVCGIPDPQNSGYRDGRKALIHLAAFYHPDHECSRDNPASFARVETPQQVGAPLLASLPSRSLAASGITSDKDVPLRSFV